MKQLIGELTQKIKSNRLIIYFGIAVYLLGLLIGLFFSNENVLNLYNEYALNFINSALLPSSSAIKFTFTRLFNGILIFIPIILLSLNAFTVYFSFIFVFYKGFVLALSLKCLIITFGFNGIMIFIFLSLIQSIALAISITLYVIFTKSNTCGNNIIFYNLKCLVISLLILALGLLIELLFLICILRPFNFFF